MEKNTQALEGQNEVEALIAPIPSHNITVAEFLKLMRMSQSTLSRLLKAEKIQCHRYGGEGTRIFFTPDDVRAFYSLTAIPAKGGKK